MKDNKSIRPIHRGGLFGLALCILAIGWLPFWRSETSAADVSPTDSSPRWTLKDLEGRMVCSKNFEGRVVVLA